MPGPRVLKKFSLSAWSIPLTDARRLWDGLRRKKDETRDSRGDRRAVSGVCGSKDLRLPWWREGSVKEECVVEIRSAVWPISSAEGISMILRNWESEKGRREFGVRAVIPEHELENINSQFPRA